MPSVSNNSNVYLFSLHVFRLMLLVGFLGPVLCLAEGQIIKPVANFSTGTLAKWRPVSFGKDTVYKIHSVDQTISLSAMSQASASGLVCECSVSIKKYPYLNWSWLVDEPLPPLAETTKQGDDYAARIYVVISDGWFFWQTKALNYVWSSHQIKGSSWPNAYAPDNTKMIALRSNEDGIAIWHQEKRNVYEDLRDWLGKEVNEIKAVAIMTDSDNSELETSARYGDIYFSKN